jgi:hypothetical protein
VQLKKEVANPLNKLTVVIVSLSAISFLMTDDSIAVSMPRISMAELDGTDVFKFLRKSPKSRRETERETGSGLITIGLLGEHLNQRSLLTPIFLDSLLFHPQA